jgi:hypothetical protein
MHTWPLKLCSLALLLELSPAFGGAACQSTPPPDVVSQDQLLSAARQYAGRYMASLPSFVCTQTTDQYEAGKKGKRWHKGDKLTEQLVWDQGREQRTLQLVNNHPASRQSFWRSPLVSEGEFGNLLDSVLGMSSRASFAWRGRETTQDKPVGVFEYRVEHEHSPMRLNLGSIQATIAFHGLIYIDEASGAIWRITNEAADLPPQLQTRSVWRSVDYGEVFIGPDRYVLPIRATVLLDTGQNRLKNELRFEAYRKFGADSHITFAADDTAKPQIQKE